MTSVAVSVAAGDFEVHETPSDTTFTIHPGRALQGSGVFSCGRPWAQSFAPSAQMLGRSESYDAVIPLESCTDIPTSMYVRVTTVDAAEGVLQGFTTGVDCRLPQW